MADTSTTTQYGVEFPNGTYDWNVQSGWGDLLTLDAQQMYQADYESRLKALGAEPGVVKFVKRTVTTQYSDPEPFDPILPDTEESTPTEEPTA